MKITTHLGTRSMSQIRPVHLEAQVIPRMHHLVRQRILQMPTTAHLIRADQDAMIRTKPTALAHTPRLPLLGGIALGVALRHHLDARRAAAAPHVLSVQLAVQRGNVVVHETDDGAVAEQVLAPLVALGAVARFVADVGVFAEEVFAGVAHAVREDVEVVGPGRAGVVAGDGGVVGRDRRAGLGGRL